LTDMYRLEWLVPMICSGVSSCASVMVLLGLRKLDQRGKLRVRQLLHLSCADLVFSVGGLVYFAIPMLGASGWFGSRGQRAQVVCVASYVIVDAGFCVSALVEVHLAVSLLAKLFRMHALLKCLWWAPWILWILGVALSVGEAFLDQLNVSSTFNCVDGRRDIFGVCVAWVCLGVCVFVYVVCHRWMSVSGNFSQQNRIYNQMSYFLWAWIVCVTPLSLSIPSGQADSITGLVVQSLVNLNGTANAVVYFVLDGSGSLRRRRMVPTVSRQTPQRIQSFNVMVGTTSTTYLDDDSL